MGAPKAPAHLSRAARKVWREIVPQLLEMGTLARVDGGELSLYCCAAARWAEAERELEENGVVVKSPNGYPIQNPFLAVANRAMSQMHKFGTEFGITPASRTRVHAQPKKEKAAPSQDTPVLRIAN